MYPEIRKTDNFIEIIGHYSDPMLCAKLTLLTKLYAIEYRNGYAKFSIDHLDKFKLIDSELLFAAEGSWINDAFRQITITGGDAASLTEFKKVLESNAEQLINSVVVTWKNYNGDILEEQTVEVGATPSYTGAEPIREGTSHYSYSFSGWSPEVGPVTTNTVYIAQFETIVNIYLITWLDDDGTELHSEQVEYGVVPSYNTIPVKASSESEVFTFAGWSPSVVAVTEPATYIATYTSQPRKYTITWQNTDLTVLAAEQVAYGEIPSYTGETPTKANTDTSYFTFSGWSPEVTAVVGDATYTAVFTETILNSFDINLHVIFIDIVDDANRSIQKGGTAVVKIAAKDGFTLPSAIEVTGADYTYDLVTGEIVLSNPTGDVTISARAARTINSKILVFDKGKIHSSFFGNKSIKSMWLGNIQIYGVKDTEDATVEIIPNAENGLTYVIVSKDYTTADNASNGITYDIKANKYIYSEQLEAPNVLVDESSSMLKIYHEDMNSIEEFDIIIDGEVVATVKNE